jgi:SAM-dependent methyltransferase
LLGTERGYSAFRRLIRADHAMTVTVREHIRPVIGDSVLDLGCGPGDLARLLPEGVRYVGVDHNEAYLSSADPGRGGDGPLFINADLGDLAHLDLGHFDIAVAIGVLHHLDDDTVVAVLSEVRQHLFSGARFVSVDPAFHPEQRSSARVMMALDRGRFVRHPSDYLRLVREVFSAVDMTVRHDLLPFPYTHCVLDATA